MINTKFFLLASAMMSVSNYVFASEVKNLTFNYSGSSLVNNIYTTHTPTELKPISFFNSDKSVKLAAVCSVGGGGCNGLSFGSSKNSMKLDKNILCEHDGFVNSCPAGYVFDTTQRCPFSTSYFKCRPCINNCDSGYSFTACNSQQVQTASYKNECTNTCYKCRYKTCEEGGYASSITSCQNGTAIAFANKTCYRNVSTKTCENGGYKSSVPSNNVCSTTSYCGRTCQTSCYQPTCDYNNSGYKSSVPTNNVCTPVTYYGRTCYKDCYQPTCENGNYKSGVPTNQVCTQVTYYGRTCYKNCYQPTCENGGYLSSCPTNQIGTSVTYYGRNCLKDCSDDPGAVCKAAGYTQTSCDKFMISENCPSDSTYKKCTHTCGSRIFADNPTYNIDGQGNYSNPVNVITKNGTSLGGAKTTYSNVNFPQYEECKALPKPVITLTAREYSPGYVASTISGDRIENIDFVVNFTPYTKPKACNYIYILRDWNGGLFCYQKQSEYSSYGIYNGDMYCNKYGVCVDDCYNSSSSNYNDYYCEEYRQATDETGTYNLCDFLYNSYNSSCQTSSSSSIAVQLNPSTRTQTNYTPSGCSSLTKYVGTMYLKNVNLTVNGNPTIATTIGGGAHYESTVVFEGTNKITGGTSHAVWVRGHNTCSYGKVKGTLQVASGASLTLNKPACIYTGWNGAYNKYGTISGTVTTNCSTYTSQW